VSDGGVLEADGAAAHRRLALRAGDRAGFALQRVPGVEAAAPEPIDPFAALSHVGLLKAVRCLADAERKVEA
jgi:hypothetical protein